MGLEVELKAHVAEADVVKDLMPEPLSYEEKDDYYYAKSPDEPSLFRIRKQVDESGAVVLFTYKEKHCKGGVESNNEYEFTSPGDEFDKARLFAEKLGYVVKLRKHKRGWQACVPLSDGLPAAHAELLEVGPLGWFLEIEIILEDSSLRDKAEKALHQVLAGLGGREEDIEPLPYSVMLTASSAKAGR